MTERREFQRLHLTRPADGWFGDYAVRILDVSANGALIEHEEEIPNGARALLRFYWRGTEVEIMAETVRGDDGRSGLTFVETSELLLDLIAHSTKEVLLAQEANAKGLREDNVISGDETLTAASAGARGLMKGFIIWTLTSSGEWKKASSLIPDQPEDGFTVAAGESAEQVEMLQRSYETGDEEGRRMIHLLAELSVVKSR
jgi:PilZ domain